MESRAKQVDKRESRIEEGERIKKNAQMRAHYLALILT